MTTDDVRVCVVHLAFVPCRHGEVGSECYTSTRSEEVAAVRAYQQDGLPRWKAHAIIDTLEAMQRNDGSRDAD